MKLYRFTPFPSGGFPFNQVWNGVDYKFPDIGLDIQSQAVVILKWRKANGVPRASFDETLSDLNEYTCARLGNDPRWCGENGVAQPPQRTESKGCSTCGVKA